MEREKHITTHQVPLRPPAACVSSVKLSSLLAYAIVFVNAVLSVFIDSYIRLHSSCFEIRSNGELIALKPSKVSFVASWILVHNVALHELSHDLSYFSSWCYTNRVLGKPVETASGIGCNVSLSSGSSDSSLSKDSGSLKDSQKPRKRKSVTFNEHVEVRLIASSRVSDYQLGYFVNRYNLVNQFTLIPANTFVQRQ
ncbi:putative integral membrane protein [Babesia bovis T2Bo]|uniref:Uncharacterized protein n=1 Tax=Babesia bovis TaxID=5865 RepID=A7ASL3_BABBO|nr:putative integral membrane protein [Babesia bovis T2Bo]EDO07532.1 putative integral membrane protein [Babesia bovis T2Bo]BAN64488.1 hypothetical protein [Babesia bovis]|eukprot:XP_001611100.1 hypothetical protein [Babesia bovis T2Bo]